MLNSIHQLSHHSPIHVLGALPSQHSQPFFTKGITYGVHSSKPSSIQEAKEQKAKHYFQK
jgi:hypothetical protein